MSQQAPTSVTETPIPGGWTEEEVAVGGHTFQIVLPAQPDAFLEQLMVEDDGDEQNDPYWAAMWTASRQTAELLLAWQWPVGTRAVELGCGVGLLGLAGLAAKLDVTFTDRQQIAVDTALENAARNGFPAARGRLLDWRAPQIERFPLLLAADVLYDSQLHVPLLNTISAALTAGGVCWLGDPGRSSAETFATLAIDRGCDVRLLDSRGAEVTAMKLGEFRLLCLRSKPAT